MDNDKEHFIKLCNEILNNSTIYDRRLFKDEFKKIYNQNKFNFPLNDNMLSNLINNWRIHSNRFTKLSIFDNKYDYENRLIFREYRVIPVEENNKKANASFEYVIYGNNENIARMRKSNHFFIDGTFHHPSDFSQLLIIMYKDCITSLKIPGLYILLNSKKEQLYDLAFHSIIKLLTNNETLNLDLQTIVTDQEKGLINSINKNFPNVKRIACLFHYKQDILRNLKTYGLFKKSQKNISLKILYELGKLPFKYKGNINLVHNICKELIKNYPLYENFINQYFLKNKLQYFEDKSLDYNSIPEDCRSNSYLENYNGYLKYKLGKFRIVNWINFIHFIKEESSRSIEKLLNKNSKIDNFTTLDKGHSLIENLNEFDENINTKKTESIKDDKENKLDFPDNSEETNNNDLDLENIIISRIGL